MNNHYLIVITNLSLSIKDSVDEFHGQLLKNDIEPSTVTLILFFVADAIDLVYSPNVNNNRNNAFELDGFSEKYPFNLEIHMCKTAITRRQNEDTNIDENLNQLSKSVVISSLAQLVDLCLRSQAWTFQSTDLLGKDDFSFDVASHSDNILFVLKQLPKAMGSVDQLDDRAFTEFIDLAMTFASFDLPVAVAFGGDSKQLWLNDVSSKEWSAKLEHCAAEANADGTNTEKTKRDSVAHADESVNETLKSWQKQCRSLKDVYGVDKIVVLTNWFISNKNNASKSSEINRQATVISEYLLDVDEIVEDNNQWQDNYLSKHGKKLFW